MWVRLLSTSFQAAMTSVSAIVGSENIADAATAIVMGGLGTLLWMILTTFVGMATKFAKIALGIKFRKFRKYETASCGVMYYLTNEYFAPKMAGHSVIDFGYSFCIHYFLCYGYQHHCFNTK